MASSSREEPKRMQGIRIDSSLISTASGGEVQSELEGLGVSVFDQGTFEEGVMKQLDREVSRRAAEQRKKFLVREYSQVQLEKNTLHRELEGLSKKIASLLSRPLCDVVLSLREMKSAQEQKRKQVAQLEVRERELLKMISGKEKTNGDTTDMEVGGDAPFALPSSSLLTSEQQKLIQSGHMTPFGTSELATPTTDSQQESGDGDVTQFSSESGPSSSAGLRLCSEGFDGLFETPTPSLSPRKTVRKKGQGSAELVGQKKRKGKEKKSADLADDGDGCDGASGEGVEEGEWMVTREEVEAMEREMFEETREESTDYTTDEELGADRVLGRKKVGRKRRPLSSGDSEEEEEEEGSGRWGRRKRRRKLSQTSRHLDDGDKELYRLRMRECDVSDDPATSDKVIDGRLRIPGSIWSRLYGYQQTGVHWLWELHCQQAGGVVGDEMGLGKTIQMIAFLAGLRVSRLQSHVTREAGLGPVLVVCPATVMHQWVSEFHSWWPSFRVAILHETGTFSGRSKSALISDIIECRGVLITTYAGVRIYRDHLLPPRWDYVILDEGHKIRNPDAEVTLTCKQFSTPHRIILSGSPMQNNLRELWSLFDFVFPGKLGTLPVFMEQFSVPITIGGYSNATQVQVQTAYRCACVLRDTINPYLLRRLKADVKIQLPSKNEQVLFCKLTEYQQELYEDYVTGPEVAAMLVGRKKIFTGLAVLRKLCNHPDLVTNDYRDLQTNEKGEEDDDEATAFIRSRRPERQRRRRRLSSRASESERVGEGGVADYSEEQYGWGRRSGKMVVAEALLKMWCAQKHHVLLFSQSKMMLNILELMVQAKGYTYLRMDGDTPIKARQPLIRQFNETPSIFVFLLTTRVGGLGVNLTGADRIIIYDPDWNPSTDMQARERAWRIGQKRQVTIYRLLSSGTIEEKIYHRQIFKQFLSNRVLKDPKQRRFFKANDLYELFSLGQVHPKGGTETSAIFAGTGSDVVPRKLKKKKKKRRRSHDDSEFKSCDRGDGSHDAVGSGEEGVMWSGDGLKKPRLSLVSESSLEKSTSNPEITIEGSVGDQEKGAVERSGEVCASESETAQVRPAEGDVTEESSTSNSQPLLSLTGSDEPLNQDGEEKGLKVIMTEQESSPIAAVQPSDSTSNLNKKSQKREECERNEADKSDRSHKKKKKKKEKKKKRVAVVEGVEISGVDRKQLYRPAGEGEGERGSGSSASHDDYILTKLFRKSGVHSAIQHDSIMSSVSGDYVVIEAEAKKVAQSAARALRESRRRCLEGGRGRGCGQLTWTGQHGSVGSGMRQQPRFGAKAQQTTAKGANAGSSRLFDGQKAGTSLLPSPQKHLQNSDKSSSPSLTSSTSLLTAMRNRNSHALPHYAVRDIHKSTHDSLMREIRDFIATQCKYDGQATTEELLGHFSTRLPSSDTATFRSMLREICDFSRVHGEGRWILKSQFR